MKTTEQTFIKVSAELRRRTDISPTQKLIISYLLSFQVNDKVCYQTEEELAFELGISLKTLKRSIVKLTELGICYKQKASLHTGKRQYKNRKAIIVNTVDLKNDNQEMVSSYQSVDKVQEIEEKPTQIEFESSFNFDSEEIDDVDDYIMIKNDNEDEYQVQLDNGNLITIDGDIMINYYEYLKKEKMKIYKELINCQTQHVFNYVLDNTFENDYMYKLKNNLHI